MSILRIGYICAQQLQIWSELTYLLSVLVPMTKFRLFLQSFLGQFLWRGGKHCGEINTIHKSRIFLEVIFMRQAHTCLSLQSKFLKHSPLRIAMLLRLLLLKYIGFLRSSGNCQLKDYATFYKKNLQITVFTSSYVPILLIQL